MTRFVACAFLSALSLSSTHAALTPYSPDANTVYLFHFNEASGTTSAANSGTAGFSAIAFDGNPFIGDGQAQSLVDTILGASGFSGFGNAANVSAADFGLGIDASGDGSFVMDDGAPASPDRILNGSIMGVGNAVTLEAMVNLPALTGLREVISTDSADANRGFQFRLNAANVEFNFIGSAPAGFTIAIPTTGPDAFVANEWFHLALSYDGTTSSVYWTRVDPSRTTANLIGTNATETMDPSDSGLLVIGNEGRVFTPNGSTEGVIGLLDEVRISNTARSADQFIFVPEPSTAALLGLGTVGLLGTRGRKRQLRRAE